MIKEVLKEFGYDPERFHIAWCSSSEPDKFVQEVKEMTNRIKALGPHANSLFHREAEKAKECQNGS